MCIYTQSTYFHNEIGVWPEKHNIPSISNPYTILWYVCQTRERERESKPMQRIKREEKRYGIQHVFCCDRDIHTHARLFIVDQHNRSCTMGNTNLHPTCQAVIVVDRTSLDCFTHTLAVKHHLGKGNVAFARTHWFSHGSTATT